MNHLGDITKIDGRTVPKVSVIIGGSPCQDLSVAGKRSGLSGERSGLFMEMIRIIKEMREDDEQNGRTGVDIRPRFMVWENVPGAFSSNKGEDFRVVLEEIAKIIDKNAVIPRPPKDKWRNVGVIMGDGFSVAWRVLDAQFWGVPQRRRRIALVADFGGCTAPEILFERESLSGNTSESGTPWEGANGGTKNRAVTAVDGVKCLTPWDCQSKRVFSPDGKMCTYQAMGDGGSNNVAICIQGNCIDRADTAGCNGKGWRADDLSFTLNTIDKHAVCAAFSAGQGEKAGGIGWQEECAPSLKAAASGTNMVPTVYNTRGNGDGKTVCSITGDYEARVTDYTGLVVTQGQANAEIYKDMSPTLNCNHEQPIFVPAIGHTLKAKGNCQFREDSETYIVAAVNYRNGSENQNVNGTLQAKSNGGWSANLSNVARVGHTVRRLTPLECERLQGYPDGWTDIGEWTDSKGKVHKECADTSRYKALGNSIALPPWRYVLTGVIKYCGHEKTMASLFDGIGGFPLIWQELGGDTLWASEIEEFPIAVTKKHFN